MAELLQNWLNNEIELSNSVSNFEKDFANGYLFGELLYKFNQQANFKEFSKKENVASKLDNFQKLQPTLKNLKVKFDSKMIDAIIKEERGVALRLLYQLKMALEKVYPPTDIAVLRKTGKMGDNQPAMKIAQTKEKFDEHAATFFSQRLQVLNKPQKQLNMETHLRKFSAEKQRQETSAQRALREEQEAKERMRQEIRRAQINKLQRNAGFMEEWLQKGVEDWKKNQTIKKDRERRQLEFEYKQTEKYHNFAVKKIEEATKEVNDGIDQFEKTLKNLGINPKVRKEDAERAVSESLAGGNSPLKQSQQRGQRFAQSLASKQPGTFAGTFKMQTTANGALTLTSTGLKTKDKKTVTEKTRKERERRRRKMIVDQAKTHIDMEQKRRESQIVERMKRQAKQEEELNYEQWRTNQCKNVIVENRKLREARYEKRKELDQQTANWREEEMLNSMREQMQRELSTFKERDVEMRIVSKQAHRERRNEFGQVLFDAIFDIANEAYIHQQKSDSEEIDCRNWHEWINLFVEQMPIEGTLSKLAELKFDGQQNDEPTEEGQLQEFSEKPADPNEKLDDIELVDYLKNQGQWPASLISENQPNLEQFLTGQIDAQPAAGAKPGAKGAPAKAVGEQIVLEEGDTELPLEAPNNYFLGDAVENIINMNYDAREHHKRPKMPQYLPLKLCFIGYAFAGKKTQAERLKEQYGLQIYYLNDLVDEAIKFYENYPEPIEKAPLESEKEEEHENISFDSELNEDYNADEDFRKCGEDILNYLKQGSEVPDQSYVNLFVAKLRMTYPHKSKKQIRHELRLQVEKEREILKKIQPIDAELQQLMNPDEQTEENLNRKRRRGQKDVNTLMREKDQLKQELENLKVQDKKGWILVDFPSTFAQAKLLETALSGYVPEQECDPIGREAQITDALLLVQPTAKEVPPNTLIKSGLDAVVWFDLSRDECMRRALGRRYDVVNEKMYHIEDAPPLTTSAPLCERLVPMQEDHNLEATLIDRWISFDQSSKGLEKWLLKFGDKDTDQSILSRINAESSNEDVTAQINEIIERIMLTKAEKEQSIKSKINEQIEALEEAERERLRQAELEDVRKREDEGQASDAETAAAKKEENRVEKPEPATERVPPKDPSIENIDNDFKPSLMKIWQEMSDTYKQQMKKVFRQSRVQRERIVDRFSHLQNKYLQFLRRPDAKQEKLEQFIRDFNDFSDQFPDLREDDQTKDELHQRVDILSDELWEIIEERKEQHVEERKRIMENGWIEHELTFLVSQAQSLMQAEVDKFKQSVNIIHDYYHAFEDKLIPEQPPSITTELVAEGEELPPVELLPEGSDALNIALYTYPRLDKLFEKALKAQVVPDVTNVQAAAQDKKGAPVKGKDPKKGAEEEKPVEESQVVKDMKLAIKVEKSILRFRLTQIRNWALKRLREMRTKAIKVYIKLEDWIHVSNKAENDAVDEMCIVLKKAIEEERKIQDELRIKFMDFCVDEKIMNYIEPPPEKLPPMEEVRKDRFNISQLRVLVSELESLASQHGNGTPCIPAKAIVDLFTRKVENSKSLGDEGSLPEDWRILTEYDFQNMIRNLDKYNTGVVNWKVLATFIILLKTPIATEKNIEAYKVQTEIVNGKDPMISLDNFTDVHCWFEEFEFSMDREYSIQFPRVKYIKELLFSVNKDHAKKNGLHLEKYFKLLKAKEMTMFKRNLKTYEDILMAN